MTITIDSKHGPITMRTPTRAEWKRHLSMLAEGQRAEAEDYLFETCATDPTGDALSKILDVSPNLPSRAIVPVHAAAGSDEVEREASTIDAAARSALATKHVRGVCYVETAAGTAAFTSLDRIQRKKYMREMADPGSRGETIEWLAIATVVSPDRDTFTKWLEQFPGIPSAAKGKILALGDGRSESEGKG